MGIRALHACVALLGKLIGYSNGRGANLGGIHAASGQNVQMPARWRGCKLGWHVPILCGRSKLKITEQSLVVCPEILDPSGSIIGAATVCQPGWVPRGRLQVSMDADLGGMQMSVWQNHAAACNGMDA
jgi:hypothetical protein